MTKMFREFFLHGRSCDVAFAWFGLLVVLAHASFRAWLQWSLNNWYAEFYDVLGDSSHATAADRARVTKLLMQFGLLVLPAVFVYPVCRWVQQVWRFDWRIALVKSYLAHHDVNVHGIEGEAQRIHEDTKRFEEGLALALSTILDSFMTMIVFTPILLNAGAEARLPSMPSSWLFLVATGAAAIGALGAIIVAHPLISIEIYNQKIEGAFRTQLVLLEQTPTVVIGRPTTPTTDDGTVDGAVEGVVDGPVEGATDTRVDDVANGFRLADPAILGQVDVTPPPVTRSGPSHQLRRTYTPSPPARAGALGSFVSIINALWTNYLKLFAWFAAFNTFVSAFEQFMLLTPYVLVAPLIFARNPADRITLGTLIRVTNAFSKVFDSLSVVANNWDQVNDFRSVWRRLRTFEKKQYQRYTPGLHVQSSSTAAFDRLADMVEMRVLPM